MRIQALPTIGYPQSASRSCRLSISRPLTVVSVSVGGPNLLNPFFGTLAAGSTYLHLSLDGAPPFHVAVAESDWSEAVSATVDAHDAVVTYVPINTAAIVPTLMVRKPEHQSQTEGR